MRKQIARQRSSTNSPSSIAPVQIQMIPHPHLTILTNKPQYDRTVRARGNVGQLTAYSSIAGGCAPAPVTSSGCAALEFFFQK